MLKLFGTDPGFLTFAITVKVRAKPKPEEEGRGIPILLVVGGIIIAVIIAGAVIFLQAETSSDKE